MEPGEMEAMLRAAAEFASYPGNGPSSSSSISSGSGRIIFWPALASSSRVTLFFFFLGDQGWGFGLRVRVDGISLLCMLLGESLLSRCCISPQTSDSALLIALAFSNFCNSCVRVGLYYGLLVLQCCCK